MKENENAVPGLFRRSRIFAGQDFTTDVLLKFLCP